MDQWCTEPQTLVAIAHNYFQNIFSTSIVGGVTLSLNLILPKLIVKDIALLSQPFIGQEIIIAISQMNPNKALRPNGLTTGFFKNF